MADHRDQKRHDTRDTGMQTSRPRDDLRSTSKKKNEKDEKDEPQDDVPDSTQPPPEPEKEVDKRGS